MGIDQYIKEEYKNNLRQRYEKLKKLLEEKTFVPEPEDVWKLYSELFSENKGVYQFVTDMLKMDQFDETGKINELCCYLDDINKRASDYCSAYVLGMKKYNKEKEFASNESENEETGSLG